MTYSYNSVAQEVVCAEDAISYVTHILKNRPVLKTPKSEGIEWQWPLHPVQDGTAAAGN